MFDPMFVPPRHNPALYWLANTFLPRLAPLFGNVYDVRVSAESLARLEALRPHRAMLCPNHPTETDPIVLFWVSRIYRQRFNYLATRETLEGLRGRLLNQVGVYSVIRGFPDRESLRMTRRLLAEENRKVVIFPEGQIYERNDMLLAFHTGVAQLGFWALDDLHKSGGEPMLPIVPVALRYRCRSAPDRAIERGLADMERTLGLRGDPHLTAYARLSRAGCAVLARIEREEGLQPDENQDIDARIKSARRRALERVSQAIGAGFEPDQPPADQLHSLFNRLKSWVGVLEEDHTGYDERRYRHRAEVAAPLFRELLRLQNFIAMTGDYVTAEPTAERFLEVLGCLQTEVFGRVRHRAPLEADVRIAAPICLEEQYQDYRRNKREAIAGVTRELQDAIWNGLQDMKHLGTPIRLD
jgi:1-acyl-sn-glycerol-3-phosphate acyltransferase